MLLSSKSVMQPLKTMFDSAFKEVFEQRLLTVTENKCITLFAPLKLSEVGFDSSTLSSARYVFCLLNLNEPNVFISQYVSVDVPPRPP